MILKKAGLIFVTLIFLFEGCSIDKKNVPVESLKDVLTNLAPNVKTFEINPVEEVVLKGDKGTVIYIPADAFQLADGASPTGKVKIELKECFSLSEMIGENMSTTSFDSILETGGMIYIKASADGKELTIKEGKAFVIGFPKGKNTEEMDLFYDFSLNDTSSTWVPDYQMFQAEAMKDAKPDTTVEDDGLDESVVFKYPIEMTDDLFDYGFAVTANSGTFFNLKIAGQDRTILDYINDPTSIADSISRKFYKNGWSVYCDLNIDVNGKMKNPKAEKFFNTKENSYAFKIVKDFLEKAPAFDLNTSEEKIDHHSDYLLGVTGTRQINYQRFKKKFREQYSKYTDQAIQQMDGNSLDYYLFAATKMGWINCDRFWDMDAKKKTDFIVSSPYGANTKVQIVFKDINSIMSGIYSKGQFVFSNVPLDRKVKIIGISYGNGKPTLGVAETTIRKEVFQLKEFKEFSLDELEKELN